MNGCHLTPRLILAIAVVSFAGIISGPAFPAKAAPKLGTAVGTLSLNGKRLTLRYAYALAQPNTFDKKKIDIAVLLSEKPLSDGALKDVEELDDALKGMSGYALFEIDADGKPIREVIDHPLLGERNLQMSGFTNAAFTGKVFGKDRDRVEGTFATAKEKEFLGYRYEIKVDFAAAVVKAKVPETLPDAKTGKALPAGGGDPGKAFLELHQAILKKDLPAMLKLNASMPDPLPPENELREGMEMMAAMEPPDPKVARGFVKDDRAVLYVTAVQDNEKQYGTVEVVRTGGIWRVVRQNWSNKPPE